MPLIREGELRLDREIRRQLENKSQQAAELAALQAERERLDRQYRRVRELVNGDELTELLQAADVKGLRTLYFDSQQVWRSRMEEGCAQFESPFHLNIDVVPTGPRSGPLDRLRVELTKVGYMTQLIAEQHENTQFEFHGDGEYDIVSTGGTHTEYFLQLNWK